MQICLKRIVLADSACGRSLEQPYMWQKRSVFVVTYGRLLRGSVVVTASQLKSHELLFAKLSRLIVDTQ